MRGTIIGVFSVIVSLVAVLSFVLMRASLGDVSNRGEAQRAVTAAVAQLQVEGLRVERWLSAQSGDETVRKPFDAGSASARSESATTIANTLEIRAAEDPAFASVHPTLIALFDAKGVVAGRNRSALMRGAKIGKRHPLMLETVLAGLTGSAVWIDTAHNEQLLVSYAPVRDADGAVIGGMVVGTAFNNERLQETSEVTSKRPLFASIPSGDGLKVVARSEGISDELTNKAGSAAQAFGTDQVVELTGLGPTWDGAAKALAGYGDGRQTVIMAVTKARIIGSFASLLWPVLGVLLLGIVLTVVGAHLIDRYISEPISDLEDGLLAVINGETDLRFELEHKVLGGLVFRVNSLLNQLLGVSEDTTDADGRPSIAPSSQSFSETLNLDERMASLSAQDVDDAHALRDEPPEDYYKRIFDQYLDAKRALGDPVDHVTFVQFIQRIKATEQEMQMKHGKPFRYRIEQKAREVVFVAVPLS